MQKLETKGAYKLKLILSLQTAILSIYTLFVIYNEGWNLFSVFISNINAVSWSGQFNLDFNCYLILSGLWIMWRNKFTTKSILLGLAAMVMGIILFAPYLFYQLSKENGDLKKILLGKR